MRTQLRDRLSRYEIPCEFRVVESIPRTTNGKVDRTALEALFSDTSHPDSDPGSPRR